MIWQIQILKSASSNSANSESESGVPISMIVKEKRGNDGGTVSSNSCSDVEIACKSADTYLRHELSRASALIVSSDDDIDEFETSSLMSSEEVISAMEQGVQTSISSASVSFSKESKIVFLKFLPLWTTTDYLILEISYLKIKLEIAELNRFVEQLDDDLYRYICITVLIDLLFIGYSI